MAKRIIKSAGKAIGRKHRRAARPEEDKRDPSEDPVSSLILADAAIRAGTYIVRRTVEKGLLRGRYGSEAAREVLANKTLGQTVLSFGLAKLATRSLPGAVIVGGGAVAKTLYDRRKARRTKGEQAADEPLPPQLPDEQS
ncbi:hypothetical protein [Erythrobacter mangrovi]|uniref:DUF4235 domain-containing protein n=1 Tax=Erythrobacter mangrovi TaxID=2739433 RepID=A0A7D4BMS5_9SPHN|nr:hypothetical protein [Erythrobacter mangrovi]QKG70484.1 hypothetical protein HQR01_03390 [Erythrobacter mangrovi]